MLFELKMFKEPFWIKLNTMKLFLKDLKNHKGFIRLNYFILIDLLNTYEKI